MVEIDSAATLATAAAPYSHRLRFTVKPIVPIEEAVVIVREAIAFRESVA